VKKPGEPSASHRKLPDSRPRRRFPSDSVGIIWSRRRDFRAKSAFPEKAAPAGGDLPNGRLFDVDFDGDP